MITYLVFIGTYILIAARRLAFLPIGRPAGALLGAVAMVGVGAISPEDSYRAIDHDTILLLFAMMTITVYVERAGLFALIARWSQHYPHAPMRFLLMVCALSGGLSAFLTNDTVCVFMTPVVVTLCRRRNLPLGPYLMALATSANIGSAATLVGNPQNMIIGNLSGMDFGRFIMFSLPAALAGLCVNSALLIWMFRRSLSAKPADTRLEAPAGPPLIVDQGGVIRISIVLSFVIIGFFMGFHMGYTALAGVAMLILLERRDPGLILMAVDWPILIFFCSLFIVVESLAGTGIVKQIWAACAPHLSLSSPSGVALFTILMTVGSNLISNVPMVMLAGPLVGNGGGETGWILMAFITTVAGNLTLVGSVANIIVAERAKPYYSLGFFEYLRFGFVSTIVVLTLGVMLILWMTG